MALIPPFLLENIVPAPVAFAALSFNSWFGDARTPESRRRRVPKVVPFLVPFWNSFGAQSGPQNGPRICPKLAKMLGPFVDRFFGGFGAPWVPLGSLLEPLEALLRGLWTPKTLRNCRFVEVLELQLFGSLILLMVILGSYWPFLGRSGPKMGPEMVPTVVKKVIKKESKK